MSYRGMSKADLRASLLSLQGRTDTLKLVKDEWIFWEIWMKNMDWKNNSDVWCCWQSCYKHKTHGDVMAAEHR